MATKRELTGMQQLLPRVLGKLARESGRALALAPLWEAAVGPQLARHCRPRQLVEGTLEVVASGADWARTLEAEASTVCERLSAQLGPGVVRALSVRVE
jgi:predicted nucleic acid-binding Zn ribbon protein